MPRVVTWGLALAAGLAVLAGLLLGRGVARAHGNEVNIAVTCTTPDPGRPLTKACTAFLKYLGDNEPVANAKFQLTATREGGDARAVAPVPFKPLDQEGVYSATVTFPAYGKWHIKFLVKEPGEGEAELVEELLPPQPGASPEIRGRLQIVFSFGLGDLRNIVLRIVHLLGAVTWFALSALVLILSRLAAGEQRYRLLQRLAAIFPWAAGSSLLVVALTGIYSARYNVPTRSPGLFDPAVIARLPFGEAYLMAFLVKMALGVAILAAMGALSVALRRAYRSRVPVVVGAARGFAFTLKGHGHAVTWLAALNVLLGLLVFTNVVVLGYFHIISHVGAAASG